MLNAYQPEHCSTQCNRRGTKTCSGKAKHDSNREERRLLVLILLHAPTCVQPDQQPSDDLLETTPASSQKLNQKINVTPDTQTLKADLRYV